MVVLGGGQFLMSEVPLYAPTALPTVGSLEGSLEGYSPGGVHFLIEPRTPQVAPGVCALEPGHERRAGYLLFFFFFITLKPRVE